MNSNKYQSNKILFSKEDDLNYSDYLQRKKGVEMITTNDRFFENTPYYFSYSDFITIVKSYFHLYNTSNKAVNISKSLFNATYSNVVFSELKSHLKTCNKCAKYPDLCYSPCMKDIMYPYGKFIDNQQRMHLSSKINQCPINCDEYKKTPKIQPNKYVDSCGKKWYNKELYTCVVSENMNMKCQNSSNSCKTSLCGNTKPFFSDCQ